MYLSVKVQPSGGRLGMSYRPRHPVFESPLRVLTRFWRVELFISGLLPRGVSKESCLDKVSRYHKKMSSMEILGGVS